MAMKIHLTLNFNGVSRWVAGVLARRDKDCSETEAHTLQAFFIILRLLEDEDRTVRNATARTAGHAAAGFGFEDCSWAAVPFVQGRTFALVARHYSHRKYFVEKLLACIFR